MKVLTLVDRTSGRARSVVIDNFTIGEVKPILEANIARDAVLLTDEHVNYKRLGKGFAAHGVVRHNREEYVSPLHPTIHTQTIEGFFSIFKRGMKGVYQHASKKHMHRYLAEFDFRYSNRAAVGVDDTTRAVIALQGVGGKRLTYRSTDERA